MKKIFFSATLFLLITSCSESRSDNKTLVENAVDHTDSSSKVSFKSGRNDNMIDDIYFELIRNDKKLSALDEKLTNTYENSRKVLGEYEKVLNKSESYYRDADDKAANIKDSILKHQIESEIKINSEKYGKKTRNIKNLIAQLNENSEKMTDYYTAFKIRKTLPEIEKYQNAHPLKTDSLENFIKKQNQLVSELKNLK